MKYYFDVPRCCGQDMLVRANGIWECDLCGEETTRDQWENDCQSEAERAAERSAESSAWDSYRAAYENAQYNAMRVKRDFQ